ncbi:hypothetical protein [Stagnihabitans tardus]|uniref:Uncharacterized protein n=1 Tax=Stagnihabitans tardus TaxID=2699202 RepID=A0AAE5BTF9_9RHOB|nr:hypothetical protein [Stagnihabitans tardus]NBZ86661.1 hypothetical protein [Stagnihabitans tardus]
MVKISSTIGFRGKIGKSKENATTVLFSSCGFFGVGLNTASPNDGADGTKRKRREAANEVRLNYWIRGCGTRQGIGGLVIFVSAAL